MRLAIIGFGVVGKSVLTFLKSEHGRNFAQVTDLFVWNNCQFAKDDEQAIINSGARPVTSVDITLGEVFNIIDMAIVSPGVNINKYKQYWHKIVCELDLFSRFFDKPTIGITGSLGKTTITKLLGVLANRILSKNVVVGGNIGLGMLDLVEQQKTIDLAVLELSSFQLELSKKWAPDIAIWTNCFANHLDRHETMLSYVQAKLNILLNQNADQVALLSLSLFEGEVGNILMSKLSGLKSQIYLASYTQIDQDFLSHIPIKNFKIISVIDHQIIMNQVVDCHIINSKILCFVSDLPKITFIDNWLLVIAAIHVLGGDTSEFNYENFTLDNEHRCEFVQTRCGVDFYNDSKATVIQSTLAAVNKLATYNRPIILILGGLGKGVDRSPILKVLNTLSIKKIYCFGKECAVFAQSATCFATLEEVMIDISKIMSPGDQVLFSPSGTSYDLYKNYEERGMVFKSLLESLIDK